MVLDAKDCLLLYPCKISRDSKADSRVELPDSITAASPYHVNGNVVKYKRTASPAKVYQVQWVRQPVTKNITKREPKTPRRGEGRKIDS